MRVRLHHLIALAATFAVIGCNSDVKDAAQAGMLSFVTATVNGALSALLPIADILAALAGT